jgi:hypothetical protein
MAREMFSAVPEFSKLRTAKANVPGRKAKKNCKQSVREVCKRPALRRGWTILGEGKFRGSSMTPLVLGLDPSTKCTRKREFLDEEARRAMIEG